MRQAEKDRLHSLAIQSAPNALPRGAIFFVVIALVIGLSAYGAERLIFG